MVREEEEEKEEAEMLENACGSLRKPEEGSLRKPEEAWGNLRKPEGA